MPTGSRAKKFIFADYKLAQDENQVTFSYATEFEDKPLAQYKETVMFPIKLSHVEPFLLKMLLENLHLILGVSYWKLHCAPIELSNQRLSKTQAEFWQTVYTKGLGEFYYQNKLSWQLAPTFPNSESTSAPQKLETADKALLGFSGGKDSFVSLQLLNRANIEFHPFIVATNDNDVKMVSALKAVSQKVPLIINRQLDDALLQNGDSLYQGHVPFSAIVAFLGLVLAAAEQARYLIVNNEQGSSESNVEYQGKPVNHQWSKSEEFEQLFRKYVKDFITPSIEYFSLLRAFPELKVVELLSKDRLSLEHFISCNKNFRVRDSLKQRWCNNCAKCASTFALLGAFLPAQELTKLFGDNLYEREDLIPLFKALAGIEGVKPFDCVGTTEEIRASLAKAAIDHGDMKALAALKLQLGSASLEALLKVGSTDSLPDRFKPTVEAIQ